ncbi:hypothetical protein [Tenacibaculum aestuarii]|uniref:hypothetical protein n=1 Tax=Tenacibaculum aestuarii TaxID=362781 RepID=UPI0038939D9D
MSYSELKIIRPLYSLSKKISDKNLKIGDRFIYKENYSLLFKIDLAPKGDNYPCSDEMGKITWIKGDERVIKINGVAGSLKGISAEFKNEYLYKVKNNS